MTDIPQPPSDRVLMIEARAGSDAAWNELRARHLAPVEALARALGTPRGSAEAAFATLRDEITSGSIGADIESGDPAVPAIRALRPRAIGLLTGGTYGPVISEAADEPAHESAHDGPDERELADVAAAFSMLPAAWQTVLWHRSVELAPAAGLTVMLGRSAADVVALEGSAMRGLFESYTAVVATGTPTIDALCIPIVSMLGAHQRGTLPANQRRRVDDHLASCADCRHRLGLIDRLPTLLPLAIVPALAGVDVERYRGAIGAGVAAVGASALAARRSDRTRRLTRVGAVAAVVIAVLAAAFFIREPLGNLNSQLADLLENTTTTTLAPGTSLPGSSTDPGGSVAADGALPNRIELVFPGAPQGAVYVPGGRALNLSISLSTPAPVFAGATGTVDVLLTNNDTEDASVRFLVRSSPGVSFDRLTEGPASCVSEPESSARCTVALAAGSTASMSLRFVFDADVPDRLVVVPSIRSQVLEVPVEFVPGLLLGQVDRGMLLSGGETIGTCEVSASCPSGRREASSAVIDVPADATIERAVLVWEGDRSDAPWAVAVGLIPAGSSSAVTINAGDVPPPSGTIATGVGASLGGSGFRSVADVTDLVRSAGAGTYTIVRAPSLDEQGDGSWTLNVVTLEPASVRRLLVVIRPADLVTPATPLSIDVPVGGSVTPTTPRRLATFLLQAVVEGRGSDRLSVDGTVLGGDDPFGAGTSGSSTVAYDLEIASTEEALSFEASTTADALRLASIGVAIDIVP